MRFTWTVYGDDVIDRFRKKTIIFRDTTDNQEHGAKHRFLIPGPTSEKPVAEIDELKKTDLNQIRRRLIVVLDCMSLELSAKLTFQDLN